MSEKIRESIQADTDAVREVIEASSELEASTKRTYQAFQEMQSAERSYSGGTSRLAAHQGQQARRIAKDRARRKARR